ncbi:Asparaginase [Melghirimyces thermohalophilus]|uniref:Asparaginase n=1 Tax=Melghirimyces thermohalophilus TaxID=1236220 RepID=A0A1G6NTL5_9BACL|nr:isoaspartyl peptidase/L-asparaginase [Melghirimyces thermohalophilus]SDC70505.1 Asparaginase [Melghirimyces thermohalophilus]
MYVLKNTVNGSDITVPITGLEAKKKKAGATGFGTVGAVALDQEGNLAAATSTGGLTNKAVGRVGDSPIIGAGTYANNRSVAVSATGKGEVFIRGTAAADIPALVQYQNMPVSLAARKVVKEKLPSLGGTGGVIALDAKGHFAAPYSTPTMFYGTINKQGDYKVVLSPGDEK